MENLFRKPFLFFGLLVLIIATILFTLPINLFDGIVVRQNGLQTIEEEVPLSLSYFIGMGYDEADLIGIKEFYLRPQGYIVAAIVILGIPGLIAYRMYLRVTMKKDKE